MSAYEDSKSPSMFSTNVLEWDGDKVSRWIAHLGLPKYTVNFQENNITGDVLVHLNQADLGEIGVLSVGHRLRILKAIYNIIMAQDLDLGSDHYIPPTVLESRKDDLELSHLNLILHSFETRDDRAALAEAEIKRLTESFSRLREDLLPIFRMVKESKPLPTPDLPLHSRSTTPPITSTLASSPTYYPSPAVATPQVIRKVSSNKNLNPHVPPSTHSPRRNSQDWLETNSFHGSSANNAGKDGRKASLLSSSSSVSSFTPSTTAFVGGSNGTNGVNRQNSTGSTHPTEYSSSSHNMNSSTNCPTNTISSAASMVSLGSSATVRAVTPSLVSTSARSMSNSNISNGSTVTNRGTSFNGNNNGNSGMGSGMQSNGSIVTLVSGASNNGSGVSISGGHSEPIKDFNISPDVPCYKVLPQIARRHKVRGDWRSVGLVVCYDDQERMIGLEEKPLAIYKELQREGKKPVFMIRENNGLKTDSGFVVGGTPGGLL